MLQSGQVELPLLVQSFDGEELREQATKYGLEDQIDALLQYLEPNSDAAEYRCPERDEY